MGGLRPKGYKTVEVRTWKTQAPCDLLICASSRKDRAAVYGHAVCVVHVGSIDPLTPDMLGEAMMDEMPDVPSWGWRFSLRWPIEPFLVKGKLHIYDVEPPEGGLVYIRSAEQAWRVYKPLIEDLSETMDEARADLFYAPLFVYNADEAKETNRILASAGFELRCYEDPEFYKYETPPFPGKY